MRRFDAAVVATHADDALRLLDDPTPAERATLGAFSSSANETVLHTDASVLPRTPVRRVPWNYLLDRCATGAAQVQVSYHMNRLHRLDEPLDYVVTLNPGSRVADDAVLARMTYTHPVYTTTSVAAQAALPSLNDGRIAFAGAYHGWGFHEDGCASGYAPRRRWGWSGERLPVPHSDRARSHRARHPRIRVPAQHVVGGSRRGAAPSSSAPVPRASSTPTTTWAILHASIRSNVDSYLATQGVDLAGGRVLMFANARSLGYTFNPLTVFWCYTADGELAGVVAEVHNTYGERHCYFLRPDASGRAGAPKEFYVSPFFAVDGSYEMTFTEPGDELRVVITLRRDGAPVFGATLDARRDSARPSFLAGSLRHPLASHRVITLIKFQGVRLWLRRLPVVPRPVPGQGVVT